ncbi:hypothetical protein EDB19DRAFT_1644545 [Suillus lakei]|nr:hypothetical protein EDB19DRAFT_1644545 [Suillus lakei]
MSSSTQGLFPQVDLGNTYGALFIGVIIAAILFGLTNVQAFIYFQTHRDTGRTFYKLIFNSSSASRLHRTMNFYRILDALHLVFIVHCIYYYLVTHFANIGALTKIVWSFKVSFSVQHLITLQYSLIMKHFLQVFPYVRAHNYSCWLVIFINVDLMTALLWALYQCHVFSDLIGIEWSTYMALAAISCGDVLNASSLCYLLATSRTGFSSTDSSISKLIGFIVNTGCLTSVCSMTAIITCAVMPKNYVFLSVECLVAKCMIKIFSEDCADQ